MTTMLRLWHARNEDGTIAIGVGDETLANVGSKSIAHRITACVNACEGIPTDKLPPPGGIGYLVDATSASVAQLRDALTRAEARANAEPRITHFTVRGRGEFPIDMLRYDACFPCDPASAAAAASTARDGAGHLVPRSVKLSAPLRAVSPTISRWASFGWEVTHIDEDNIRE